MFSGFVDWRCEVFRTQGDEGHLGGLNDTRGFGGGLNDIASQAECVDVMGIRKRTKRKTVD